VDGLHHQEGIDVTGVLRYQDHAGVLAEHQLIGRRNSQGAEDQVLLICAPYVAKRVVETSDGKAFMRRSDQTVELRYEQQRELGYQKAQSSFEDEIACTFDGDNVVRDILDEVVQVVVRRDKLTTRQPRKDILSSYHLLRPERGRPHLTNGGLYWQKTKGVHPQGARKVLEVRTEKGENGRQIERGERRDIRGLSTADSPADHGLCRDASEGARLHWG